MKELLIAASILISSCVSDTVLKATEVGISGYETVKNANSLGKVADGIGTLAQTGKIKAQTSQIFIEATENLISKQPLEKQPALIEQSIDAKVAVAKNTRYRGFLEGFLMALWMVFFVRAIMYLFDRYKPKETSVTKTYQKDK